MALLPLMNPTTCDTAYFGGIEIIMWTWSASRWPSSIRHSFCSASLRNTSPKCFRRLPYNTFLRHFGIITTWYLHSHFEWLKLSNSSIQSLLEVCLAAHLSESLDGLPQMSNCYCLPGRAGGSPDCSSAERLSSREMAMVIERLRVRKVLISTPQSKMIRVAVKVFSDWLLTQ